MTNDIFYVFQHTRGSKLGVEYNNLLKNALTHTSYAYEHKIASNEKLEF